MALYDMKTWADYWATDDELHESWSNYVGWYLGELYYTSLGWEKGPEDEDNDITGNAYQRWQSNSGDNFSPLFVDLIDGYDQYSIGYVNGNQFLPSDLICITDSSIYSIIADIADEGTDLSSTLRYIKSKLSGLCDSNHLDYYLDRNY